MTSSISSLNNTIKRFRANYLALQSFEALRPKRAQASDMLR